ncbi:hypothetical protein Ga0074812_13430 [Parafrankia irregularis]|uniref:Helix-hairpin-helix domain-containing protein n=1 Tax=Parafrankia irregularis TaxID=795642 RepID=A0A0S4QWE9_9ACTN|nr:MULTISPECIES: hypothetical protein [Parafrankia]MBE3202835.1 hypothetical protein [Parafrankia sp. CH37]CUU60000.1 hypothetical protein Ga0074812_13430 [Parafrankia irregularis]
MLYLAGQILVFVLVAMLIGAGLAWLFLVAPLRRQARLAVLSATGGPEAGSVSAQGTMAAKHPLAVGERVVAAEGAADSQDREQPARPSSPNAARPGTSGVSVTSGEPGAVPERDAGVPPETAAAARAAEPRGAAGDIEALLGRLREQEERWSAEKAELVTRLGAAERQAVESERRVAVAEQQVADARARIGEIESALRAAPVDVDAASAPTVVQPVPPAVLTVSGIPAPSADPFEAESGFESVADLARETAELREQLQEAEARAAKFSSRLAMVRTEAEDAQRKVATMSTRLDRHQAEWAAERIKLLARIAEAEEVRVSMALPPADEFAGYQEELPLAVDPQPTAGPAGPAQPELAAGPIEGDEGHEQQNSSPGVWPQGEQSHDLPFDDVLSTDGAPSDDVPSDDVPSNAGAFDAGPLLCAIAGSREENLELIGAALVGAATSAAMNEHHDRASMDADRSDPADGMPVSVAIVPSWGGPAEPVPSSDNLKEIVGVGPVVESRLRVLGITTFRQLAEMGDTEVDRLAKMLDGFGGRIISDDWVGQARDLQARHHSGLA